MDDNGCDQRKQSLSSAYRLCSKAKDISNIEAQAKAEKPNLQGNVEQPVGRVVNFQVYSQQNASCLSQHEDGNKRKDGNCKEIKLNTKNVKLKNEEQQVFDRAEESQGENK